MLLSGNVCVSTFLFFKKVWNILLPEMVFMAEPRDRATPGDDGDVDHRIDMELCPRHGLDTSEVNVAVHFFPLDLRFGP